MIKIYLQYHLNACKFDSSFSCFNVKGFVMNYCCVHWLCKYWLLKQSTNHLVLSCTYSNNQPKDFGYKWWGKSNGHHLLSLQALYVIWRNHFNVGFTLNTFFFRQCSHSFTFQQWLWLNKLAVFTGFFFRKHI